MTQQIELSPELEPQLPASSLNLRDLGATENLSGLGNFVQSENLDILNPASIAMAVDSVSSQVFCDQNIIPTSLGTPTLGASIMAPAHNADDMDDMYLDEPIAGNSTEMQFLNMNLSSFDNLPNDSGTMHWGRPPKETVNTTQTKVIAEKQSAGRPRKPNPLEPDLTNEELQARLPRLCSPNEARGQKYTSIADWLSQKNTNPTSSGDPPGPSAMIPPTASIRTIIPEAEEGHVFNSEDDGDHDGIGTEDFSAELSVHNDHDPGLDNLADKGQNSTKHPKRTPPPEWFKKTMDAKLKVIEKRDTNNKLVFYEEHQTFWVPQKAKWFAMVKAKTLEPEILYDFHVFYWDP